MKNLFLGLSALLMSMHGFSQTIVTGTLYENAPGDPEGYIVTDGGRLFLQAGVFEIDPGYGIDVLTGGYMQFTSGTEVHCSNESDYWNGITIYGATVPYGSGVTANNWGLTSKGAFAIKNAKTALYMRYETANYDAGAIDITGNGYARSMFVSHGNNYCKIYDSRYYDIRIHNNPDLIVDNYTSSNGSLPDIKWKNFHFETSSDDFISTLDIVNTNMQRQIESFKIITPADGISLTNSNLRMIQSEIIGGAVNTSGIIHKITTNNLMSTSVEKTTIRAYEFGIYSENADNLLLRNNRISSKSHGILIYQTENATVSNNTLQLSKYGMEAKGTETTEIFSNQCVNNDVMSIYVNQCNDTKLSANRIGMNTPTVLSDDGIYVNNSSDTRVVRNIFTRAYRQLHFNGTNPDVTIVCNTFENPNATVEGAIIINGNPINNQGDLDAGANNWFNQLPAGSPRVVNNTTTPLIFFYTAGLAIGPTAPSLNTYFIPSGFPMSCDIAKTAQPIEELDNTEVNSPTPNPFTDYLTVGENTKAVHVYSIGGQLIDRVEASAGEVQLGHLAPGTYIVVLNQNDGSTSRHKVVKQ